jgi:hypothetical protein
MGLDSAVMMSVLSWSQDEAIGDAISNSDHDATW